MSLPNPIATGQAITADWLNKLRYEVACNTIRSSPNMKMQRDSGGTTLSPIFPRMGGNSAVAADTFLVKASGEAEVTISGGTLIHVFNNFALLIPESAPLTVADGDAVWLERTGANTWGFNNGPDTPTDKLNILLAVCTVDEDGIVTLNFDGGWHGGDIIVPEIFPVDLTNDGGSPGEGVEDDYCTFTYSAQIGSITIGSSMSPAASARVNSAIYAAGTVGIGRIKPDGGFELLAVLDELIQPNFVDVVTDVTWDGYALSKTVRTAAVISAGDASEATIDEATSC